MPYRRKKLTFAISSPDEFLYNSGVEYNCLREVIFIIINQYQPEGGDALRLESKGRHGVICR